jgi:hypothetical protein
MLRRITAVGIAGILFAAGSSTGDEDWALATSEDGVEVYTRDVTGSALKEFQATAVVPAPLTQVVAWWRDPTTYTRWIYRCVEARRVEGVAGDWGNYLKFDFPFPASDRDVVLRARLLEESASAVVYEGGNADGLVAPVEGLVRIPSLRSRWEFRAQGGSATAVVYRQHMDAGGRLPAFILNQAAVDSPLGTLRGLVRYAEANRSR